MKKCDSTFKLVYQGQKYLNFGYSILISCYKAPLKSLILTTVYEIGIINASILQMVKLRYRAVKKGQFNSETGGRHWGTPRRIVKVEQWV